MRQDKQQEEKNGIKMIAFVEVDGVGVALFQSKDKLKLTVSGSKEYISEIPLAVAEREKELVKKLPLQRITQLPDDVGSPHETEFDRGWNSYRAEVLSLITKEK